MEDGHDYILQDTVNGGPPFKVRCLHETDCHFLVVNEFDKKTFIPKKEVADHGIQWTLGTFLRQRLPQYIITEHITKD